MRISDWSSDVCSSDLAGAGVKLDRVWLTDVRSYESAEILLAPGLTALLGDNGQGKTNVLEAIAWLATLSSFRGAPTDAMIRQGAQQAIIRRSEEHTSELQSLMRISYAVFCLKKIKTNIREYEDTNSIHYHTARI